jgi:hypothetical protein
MRRWMVPTIGAVLLIGMLATPANAVSSRFRGTTAEAFWHKKHWVTATTFTRTTWYVGVFATPGDSTSRYSDLYEDVELCTVSGTRTSCAPQSSKYGDSELQRSTDVFTMDYNNLSAAHLHGTYRLHSYDARGNPVGTSQSYTIVADWTGYGTATRELQKFSFHNRCIHFSATTKGKMRPASATGTLNGTSLGTTKDTFFGGSATIQVDHEC